MKAVMMASLLIGLLCRAFPALAEEDYWWKIRAFIVADGENATEAKTPEDRNALRGAREEYMKSLSAEQLIIAGRQCGREIQDAIESGHPSAAEGAIAFAFFSEFYPRAAEDLRNIDPILQETSDKAQPAFWRRELIRILLGRRWDAKLTNDQRQQVFDCLEAVLNDKMDSILVRTQVTSELAPMLSRMHKDYSKANVGGQEGEKERTLTAFGERIGKHVKNSLRLFSDPTTPEILRRSVLANAMICYREGLPETSRVKDVVVQAFADYQDYPQSLWPSLAAFAGEDFDVANADDTLNEMIRQASDKKTKDLLQYRKRMREDQNRRSSGGPN